jgi:hypothetical protein
MSRLVRYHTWKSEFGYWGPENESLVLGTETGSLVLTTENGSRYWGPPYTHRARRKTKYLPLTNISKQ